MIKQALCSMRHYSSGKAETAWQSRFVCFLWQLLKAEVCGSCYCWKMVFPCPCWSGSEQQADPFHMRTEATAVTKLRLSNHLTHIRNAMHQIQQHAAYNHSTGGWNNITTSKNRTLSGLPGGFWQPPSFIHLCHLELVLIMREKMIAQT